MTGRAEPSVLHLDLDAFFAAVEQRDKPSLRGRPVIVGGLGPRGVVSTASYEARVFGVRSAMPMSEARARCPHAAFLAGRFGVYRAVSRVVMDVLRAVSPVIEPLSLDEAFVDLSAGDLPDLSASAVRVIGEDLRARIQQQTGITASVGAATSKTMAKIASEQAKPDGLMVIEPGTEVAVLHPLSVRVLPGVGPATAARLARLGAKTVGDLARIPENELVDVVGEAHGRSLFQLAQARDERRISSERASKSISVEDTFDRDITDPTLLAALATRMAEKVTERMIRSGHSGRTITLKVRLHDFTTLSRSATLPGPTDDARTVARLAGRLLSEIDTSDGIRLLGVGVSGLSDWVQDDLFTSGPGPGVDEPLSDDGSRAATIDEPTGETGHTDDSADLDTRGTTLDAGARGTGARSTTLSHNAHDTAAPGADASGADAPGATLSDDDLIAAVHLERPWVPGMDVVHEVHGPGWVWGGGLGRVTVRFETADTPPGPVHTFPADDPALHPAFVT